MQLSEKIKYFVLGMASILPYSAKVTVRNKEQLVKDAEAAYDRIEKKYQDKVK